MSRGRGRTYVRLAEAVADVDQRERERDVEDDGPRLVHELIHLEGFLFQDVAGPVGEVRVDVVV
jgi:hypothetical protein